MDNDTYGPVTTEELQALRDRAHTCSECGHLADVDPVFHEDRYGHAPRYTDGDGTWRWDTGSLTWQPVKDLPK